MCCSLNLIFICLVIAGLIVSKSILTFWQTSLANAVDADWFWLQDGHPITCRREDDFQGSRLYGDFQRTTCNLRIKKTKQKYIVSLSKKINKKYTYVMKQNQKHTP